MMIKGVKIKRLRLILDERGYLQECFRSDWEEFKKFGQAYVSVAFPNVVKAWHMHKVQTDNMVCVKGNGKLVLIKEHKDGVETMEVFFGEKNPVLVSIPPNIWHGFKAMGNEPIMVLNCPTEVYNYDKPDEYRKPYNDFPYNWDVQME